MNPAPTRNPWHREWLRWLQDVQDLSGVRRYDPATWRQLVARHSVGETAQDAAAWLSGLLTSPQAQASPSQKSEILTHE